MAFWYSVPPSTRKVLSTVAEPLRRSSPLTTLISAALTSPKRVTLLFDGPETRVASVWYVFQPMLLSESTSVVLPMVMVEPGAVMGHSTLKSSPNGAMLKLSPGVLGPR